MKGVQLQNSYVLVQDLICARLFFVQDAFFVHGECTQGGHVGNKIWGIDAMWGHYSKLRK
jgi:hypothetical protein